MSHPLRVVAHVGDVVEDLLYGPIDLDAFFDAHGSASCAPNTFSTAMMPAHMRPCARFDSLFTQVPRGRFCELRRDGVLGSSLGCAGEYDVLVTWATRGEGPS